MTEQLPDQPNPDPAQDDRCEMCGYALEGLAAPGVCPECGTGFKKYRRPIDPCYEDACNACFLGVSSVVLVWIPPIGLMLGCAGAFYAELVGRRISLRRGGWASRRPLVAARCASWLGVAGGLALLSDWVRWI